MKTVIAVLRKIPVNLRFPALIVLAAIGFVIFGDGENNARTVQAIIGAAVVIFVFLIFRYIYKSKSQL